MANEKQSAEQQEKLKRIVRRDTAFLLLGAIAASAMSWMELNAGNVEVRGKGIPDAQGQLAGIIDAGYIATTPLHNFLKKHRDWNDALAFINTVIGVFGPGIYMARQTLWCGDYEPVFRYLCISVLRSLCGWFTFLPPDPSYLMSFQDFPDIIQCLTKDCGNVETAEINPFLSFFSGHVATLVICANHMYLKGNRKMSIFFHIFNVLQILRLLATRGHYSIDIIIGWYMAVRISNPAGRLGRYFSRGDASFESALPSTATEAFEKIIGVDVVKDEARMSVVMKMKEVQTALLEAKEDDEVFAEPTVKLAAEGKLDELLGIIAPKEKAS